jgi:hypothetical protein
MQARVTPTHIINVILSLPKDLGVAQRRSFDFAQDDIVLGLSFMNIPG